MIHLREIPSSSKVIQEANKSFNLSILSNVNTPVLRKVNWGALIKKDYRKDPWIVPVTSLSSTSMEWRHVYTWPPLRLALKPPIAEVPPNKFLPLEGSLPPSIELFIRFVITVDGVAVGISSKTANCSPVWALHKCSEPSQDATLFPGNKQMSTTACTPGKKGVAQLVKITWKFLWFYEARTIHNTRCWS